MSASLPSLDTETMQHGESCSRSSALLDQLFAADVQASNVARATAEVAAKEVQARIFDAACAEIENVRGFVDVPENILGSPATKHGEIAEVAEVGVRRAWDVFEGREFSAHDDVPRTGRIDYVIDGQELQSKFCAGLNDSLRGVKTHLDAYPDFVPEGGGFVIPRDQYELLRRVISGDHDGIDPRTVAAAQTHAEQIEVITGKSALESIRPASFDYEEVKPDAINDTLNEKQKELAGENDERIEEIQAAHTPSLAEAAHLAGKAAAIAGGVTFVRAVYVRYRDGKNIFKGEFSIEDWTEVGLETAKGSAIGGVTGGALYLMSNCAGMSAPFAGAMASAAKGLAPLVLGYHRGELSLGELVDTGCIVCSEVAIVAAAAALGQTLIPIPIAGAMIGSIAGQVLAGLLAGRVKGSSDAIASRIAQFQTSMNSEQVKQLKTCIAKYAILGDLADAAFDIRLNEEMLDASFKLALTYGVHEEELLGTSEEVDRFMLA